jgi:uncharacterized protein YjbI with pentapeptide repeats
MADYERWSGDDNRIRGRKWWRIGFDSLNFNEADFRGTKFIECNLNGTALNYSYLSDEGEDKWIVRGKAVFARCKMVEVGLMNVRGSEVQFTKSDLSKSNLSQSNFRSADFSFTDLSSADLTGTNLIQADLSHANLCGTKMNAALYLDTEWATNLWEAIYDDQTDWGEYGDIVEQNSASSGGNRRKITLTQPW